MDSSLQRAIDNLRIHDVYLRSAMSEIAEGFEPKYAPNVVDLEVQFKHLVARANVLSLDSDEQQLCRVHVDLGARWVELSAAKDTDATDLQPKALIEGTMVAEYLMHKNPGEEALKLFAMQNASFHVWPYWREYLSAQCLRMNLPKITLPAVQFAANQAE